MMKAETKAKRRATLDLLGLGILDETETETIANARRVEAPAIPANSAAMGAGRISQFKKRYEPCEDIVKVLEQATGVKDIANLYYVNAEQVQANPELKSRFNDKKNAFFSNAATGVAA